AMSYFLPSKDVDLVRPVTACLVAVYGAELGRGACAEIEPLLMMRPPLGSWLFISLIASWVQRNTPVRLMSTTAFHCSKVKSSIGTPGAPMPALLNSTSRRPKASLAFANRARTDCGSLTSVGTASARAPAPDSATAFSSGSFRRPARATRYPSFNSAIDTALPMPVPAPVTMATLLCAATLESPPDAVNRTETSSCLAGPRQRGYPIATAQRVCRDRGVGW